MNAQDQDALYLTYMVKAHFMFKCPGYMPNAAFAACLFATF